MKLFTATILAIILLFAAAPSVADDPVIPIVPNTSLALVPNGGAAGGDAVYCNNCDFIGPRNFQGGGPGGQNFDLGAGSTADPANLSLNWDIGKSTNIFEGHKRRVAHFGADGSKFYDPQTGRLLAWFGPKGIRFYIKPKIIR
jgi:hypothetical protein